MRSSNSLVYKTSKIVQHEGEECTLKVCIRLNDECQNGHQDFAITGSLYRGRITTECNLIRCGSIHDTINEYMPELKVFTRLHLCTFEGVPMHAVDNGYYHLKNGFTNAGPQTPEFPQKYKEYYRLNSGQFAQLQQAENKLHFAIMLESLGIVNQWRQEATKAIKILEDLTDTTFVIDSTKGRYEKPSQDVIEDFNQNVKEGFFSAANIAKRAKEKEAQAKEALISSIANRYDDEIEMIKKEKVVKLWLIDKGFNKAMLGNTIYYTHSNTIKFNVWEGRFNYEFTEDYFNTFCNSVSVQDLDHLPHGIIFAIGGKVNKQYSNISTITA